MADDASILHELDGGVLRITINRPAVKNALGSDDRQRVRKKRDGDRWCSDGMCICDDTAENGLVPAVDPVEVADGHEGAPQAGGDIFAAPDHIHKSLFKPP